MDDKMSCMEMLKMNGEDPTIPDDDILDDFAGSAAGGRAGCVPG